MIDAVYWSFVVSGVIIACACVAQLIEDIVDGSLGKNLMVYPVGSVICGGLVFCIS